MSLVIDVLNEEEEWKGEKLLLLALGLKIFKILPVSLGNVTLFHSMKCTHNIDR